MKTMEQNKTGDMADLMYKGNDRGVRELKHAIHKYKDAGIYATELAKEMIDFEEENSNTTYKSYIIMSLSFTYSLAIL